MTYELTNDTRPNCGPYALATVLGQHLYVVEATYAITNGKSKAWRGRSNIPGLTRTAKVLGHRIEFGRGNGTLGRFTKTNGFGTYLVRVGGHFVAVVDGLVIDQRGRGDERAEQMKRKRVTHVARIGETT